MLTSGASTLAFSDMLNFDASYSTNLASCFWRLIWCMETQTKSWLDTVMEWLWRSFCQLNAASPMDRARLDSPNCHQFLGLPSALSLNADSWVSVIFSSPAMDIQNPRKRNGGNGNLLIRSSNLRQNYCFVPCSWMMRHRKCLGIWIIFEGNRLVGFCWKKTVKDTGSFIVEHWIFCMFSWDFFGICTQFSTKVG